MTAAEGELDRAQTAYDYHHCPRCEEDRECLTLHGLVDRLDRARKAVEDEVAAAR